VLLKPQMAIPGSEFAGGKAAPADVAQHTLNVMRRCAVQSQLVSLSLFRDVVLT